MQQSSLPPLSSFMEPVIELAKRAGQAILKHYLHTDDIKVTTKADSSPVTVADIAAHEIIKAGLAKLTPDIPLLSEEAANIPFDKRTQWQRYWLVDPLDGTKEFIHRTDDFTVNIALIEQDKSVLGVIYVPMFDSCYYAYSGGGVFKQIGIEDIQAVHVRPVLDENLVIAVSRRHVSDKLNKLLNKFNQYQVIHRGSSIKSCMVAEGSADVYPCLGPTSEWDTAAAQCIVEEAGGIMMDVNFSPLRYNTKDSLINPPFIVVGDKNYDWQRLLNI